MTQQTGSSRQQKLASISAASMANRDTPLIRNAWYVAAKSSEVTREFFARQYLGISTVLFRKEDGTPVALQNRCCHRSFPLSEGKLDGDVLECGYHGFRYDCSGKCVAIPSQKKAPENIRLRSFPVIEKEPFIWIWPGDPELADESLLPHQEYFDHPDWAVNIGYLNIKGSYVHLHENLLDLSHLSFLHDKTFGTPEYARAPLEATVEDDHFEVWRHVECELPPIYAKPLGWEGDKATRSSGSLYVSPGLHMNTGILKNIQHPGKMQDIQPMVKVAQLITPETNTSTNYYYAQCRNFALDDKEMGKFMLDANQAAFSEDVFAIEHINNMQNVDETPGFYEIDVPADLPGVSMRRLLKKLSDAEQE
jgi:phenylpropionate dioxygenase-like ring-hydroxylating dioxygenase large terminal subunit